MDEKERAQLKFVRWWVNRLYLLCYRDMASKSAVRRGTV